jgi:hypothetical protein
MPELSQECPLSRIVGYALGAVATAIFVLIQNQVGGDEPPIDLALGVTFMMATGNEDVTYG